MPWVLSNRPLLTGKVTFKIVHRQKRSRPTAVAGGGVRIGQARHRRQQHAGIVAVAAHRRSRPPGRCSTISPWRITCTRSASAGDHAHVMADQGDGGLLLGLQRAQDFQDLRLHRHVQRGGGLVGDQQVGPGDGGHGDHHPLAHAAGQFVGILPHAAARFRECGHSPASRAPASRASSRGILRCSVSASVIWAPTVMCGVSEVSGSWKIMVIFEPRKRIQPFRRRAQNFLAAIAARCRWRGHWRPEAQSRPGTAGSCPSRIRPPRPGIRLPG